MGRDRHPERRAEPDRKPDKRDDGDKQKNPPDKDRGTERRKGRW